MNKLIYLAVAASSGFLASNCTSNLDSPVPRATGRLADNRPRVGDNDRITNVDKLNQESSKIRFATFNLALNRKTAGALIAELESGSSAKAKQLAEVIQRVRPNIILLNEIDYDSAGRSVELFCQEYLSVAQSGQKPIEYRYRYIGPVNTGVAADLDLNRDGQIALPDDGFGYGAFPGQYGMAVLSQFPIDRERVRTFQKFLWKDMPNARLPVDPQTNGPYYSDEILSKFRLSSKSHWDIPIQIDDRTIHLICAHPTPPVFDGPEDRNGTRNFDEIRLIIDYVSGESDYIYDDLGNRGALAESASFVIAGDMNADPADGEKSGEAGKLLTEHPRVQAVPVPTSHGAKQAGLQSGGTNEQHRGDHAADTGDFSDDRAGNLRVDYVLPSADLTVIDSGVFWPASGEPGSHLNAASDHHLVWIDIQRK